MTPLELFFDLVFVLAITQCTALIARHPTWAGLAQGLLVLGVVWWAWVGYAWLTSVIDPELGAIRLVFFGSMAALLVCAICVPGAFVDLGLAFAIALGVFRTLHIALFTLASPGDPGLRRSVQGLAVSTALSVVILASASFFDGLLQGLIWLLAIVVDLGGPYLFGNEGWKLEPTHFADRHGLIVLIALGESIVAVGAGAAGHLDLGIVVAAVLGVGVAAALWWIYFDVVSHVSLRRLADAEAGPEQNSLARDSYSYIHLLMVAGIVLVAFALETVLHHTDKSLHWVQAAALCGGLATYLLGLVAFRLRHIQSVNYHRLGLALVFVAMTPLAVEIPAVASVGIAVALLWAMIALELRHYDERRDRLREEISVAAAG